MLKPEIREIIAAHRRIGWVLEPEAKRLFALAGLTVPRFAWCRTREEALAFAARIGYPVAAKVVSPKALHKTEVGGVRVGLGDDGRLGRAYDTFGKIDGFQGVLVEEMVKGVEVIVGAKMDHQFGPVVLFGLGGTAVEIYQDTAIRMAPLKPKEVGSMLAELKAGPLLTGHRGSKAVNLAALTRTLVRFSRLAVELEGEVESIDLNPVMCGPKKCIVADARIVLARSNY